MPDEPRTHLCNVNIGLLGHVDSGKTSLGLYSIIIIKSSFYEYD